MKRKAERFTYTDVESSSSSFFRLDFGIVGCITSGILLGLMVLALLSPENGLPKVQRVLNFKRQLQADIQQLEAENERLRHDIHAMKTEPFQQEKIAREELNMALPGDIIYKFAE